MAEIKPLDPVNVGLKFVTSCAFASAVAYFVDPELVTSVALVALLQTAISLPGSYALTKDEYKGYYRRIIANTAVAQIGLSVLALGIDVKSLKVAVAVWGFVRIPKLLLSSYRAYSENSSFKDAIAKVVTVTVSPMSMVDFAIPK